MQRSSIRKLSWSSSLVLALAALAAGCDSGSHPVSPEGTLFTVVANPSSIPLNGASTIEVRALEPSGVPVREGTEVSFHADLGRIEETAQTDQRGVARATLVAGDIPGTAKVTVTSGVSTASIEVAIESRRPIADFDCTAAERTVSFTDESTGDPTSWLWEFGDGRTSSEREPTHVYRRDGTYTVRLTVSNAAGEDSLTRFITLPPEGELCA